MASAANDKPAPGPPGLLAQASPQQGQQTTIGLAEAAPGWGLMVVLSLGVDHPAQPVVAKAEAPPGP